MGLAHGVGWAVRASAGRPPPPGSSTRSTAATAAGLLLFGLALLSAVAVWFSGAGPVGARLADTVRLFLGAISVVVPVLLLIGACAADARARSIPSTAAGAWSAGPRCWSPPPRCCTSDRTRPTRASATTPAAWSARGVGSLLERRGHRLGGRAAADPAAGLRPAGGHRDPDQQGPGAARPAGRRLVGAPPAGREARTTEADEAAGRPAASARPSAAAAAAARPGRRSTTRLDGVRPPGDPGAAPQAPGRGAGHPQAGRAAGALARADPGRAARAHRRWRATTRCRRPNMLGSGAAPKTRSKANDEVIAALTGRLRPVRRGRRGHRLHPGPDGHPVRGGARARASRSSGSPSSPATSRTR